MSVPAAVRAARFLWQESVVRRVPHGLMHWRYAQRHLAEPLASQRRIWLGSLPALPRPAWLAVEASLWLRWQLWSGPRSVLHSARVSGRAVRDEEGLGLARQAWRAWTLAVAYCLPPSETYRYRLYRPCNRPLVGEFVYDHTVAAFHQARNCGPGATSSLALLADKARQASELSALGVPVVPNLAVVGRGATARLDTLVPPGGACFCKPRHGARGQGAFAVYWEGGGLVVEPLHGGRLTGVAVDELWAQLLDKDDMLVQPRLSTGSELADLATDDDVVTVRYISERDPGGDGDGADHGCYSASIELPAGRSGEAHGIAYVILEVDAVSGVIKRFPPQWLSVDEATNYDRVYTHLDGRSVPGWDRIRHGSHVAHAHFPGVHAIAWDWAVTPGGPLLLEGNGGWGPALPQMLKGGLLARRECAPGRHR